MDREKQGAGGTGRRAAWASLACALLFSAASAADWPMFRGDVARTGRAAEQAAPPLSAAWTFDAGGGILSSPAVADGKVYFGSRDGGIYALSAQTGAQLWRFQTGNWVESSPAVSGGVVYAASMDGNLYALDGQTGGLVWLAALGAPSVSSPLVLRGRVYAGTGLPEKKLKVFDALTGEQVGGYPAGQPVDSAPAFGGSAVYFGSNDGKLHALDVQTLAPPAGWPRETAGSFRLNPVAFSGGALYALPGHDDKKAYVFDAAGGDELRTSAPLEQRASWQTFTAPAVSGARLYFSGAIGAYRNFDTFEELGAGDNYLSAVDTGTLASVWASSPSLGAISGMGLLSSPVIANDMLYAGTVDGRLVGVGASTGGVRVALALSSAAYSSPAVANGKIYIGDMNGRLHAFSAGRAAAVSLPAPGAVVNGTVAVRGYAASPDLAGYELAYSSGGAPAVWHLVSSAAAASTLADAGLALWDTSALPNGAYSLRLTVLENGAPAYDNTAILELRVNSVPQPPAGLAAADVPGDSGNAIALSWTPAPGAAQYRVYRDDGGGFSLLASTAPSPAAFTDSSAATGAAYTYAVRSYDGWLESEDSNHALAVSVNDTGDNTPPGRVTDLSAEPGGAPGTAALTWTAPGDDGYVGTASSFIIKYSTSPAFDWAGFDGPSLSSATRPAEGPAGDNISWEVQRLLGGVTYYFALKAADAVPNYGPLSNVATAWATADALPPLPPSGLSVADAPGDDGGRLALAWALSPDDGGGSRDVYGYRVYRRTQSGSFTAAPYAEVPAGAGSYVDPGATENVRFYYAVAAYDSTNPSPLSGEASGISADNYRFVDASNGTSVRLADGAAVEIPGGSLSQNDSILVTRLDPGTYQPLASVKPAARAVPTNVVYEVKFRNSATTLKGKARVTLPYSLSDVAGMEAENLRIYTLSGADWSMLNTSSVDAAVMKVSAEVSRFSVFRIMEYLPSGDLFSDGEVYSYPNPAKGDTVTFKFRVAVKAHVSIDVYNVAGEQVASFERSDCPAGVASEIVWNVKRVASGVYVYRVRAQSASGGRTVVKKLAIAH